jgi:DNA invertase Pin-like site-specific DNA recombinase
LQLAGYEPVFKEKEAISKAQVVRMPFEQQEKSVAETMVILGISRATLYRYLKIASTTQK